MRLAWALFGFLFGVDSSPLSGPLSLFNISGTAFDKGFQLGYATQDLIKKNFALDPSLPQLLNWSISTAGAPVWQRIWSRQKELYPDYVAELEGIAAGAQVSLDK